MGLLYKVSIEGPNEISTYVYVYREIKSINMMDNTGRFNKWSCEENVEKIKLLLYLSIMLSIDQYPFL